MRKVYNVLLAIIIVAIIVVLALITIKYAREPSKRTRSKQNNCSNKTRRATRKRAGRTTRNRNGI